MAERRMFTKKVTDDDNFMALSASAQALYLHLSMAADDDGFCNQVSISMFKAHASVQDLQALLEKRYIYQFENGVIVIKHWRMANALRKDRYTATAFQEELAKLELKDNGSYTMKDSMVAERLPVGCQPVAERLTQDRIDKDSIEQVRLDKSVNTRARAKKPAEERHKYGEYENVLLSDTELEKLKAEFPYDWEQRIEALSAGIAAKGYKYKNFLAAIRNWAKRDAERGYNTGAQKPAQAKNKAAEQLDAFYDMAAEWASEGE
jgi:hypothetical protein